MSTLTTGHGPLTEMLYLAMPYGSNFGWGVLGKEIALALAELVPLRILAPANADQRLDDEFDRYRIGRLLGHADANCTHHAPRDDSPNGRLGHADRDGTHHAPRDDSPGGVSLKRSVKATVNGPVIHAVITRELEPFVQAVSSVDEVGYAVFEETVFAKDVIERARRRYRRLAAASGYCAEVLGEHGLSDVAIIPHGVDTTLFSPRAEASDGGAAGRTFLTDRFIVFSGGKLELRKGQDIVIRAYKVLQDRHKDVMLVNSWHNAWPKTRDTLASSKLIHYKAPKKRDDVMWVNGLLAAHGIDIERVITCGPRDHRLLPALYHATDLGLFRNRAEGGNNMVLMEYLACGKPALASYNSGHKDILRRQNAVLIETHRPMEIRERGELVAVWSDPSLEETIAKLEWCYQHRDQLQPLAQQAARDMRQFTWRRVAEGLLRI